MGDHFIWISFVFALFIILKTVCSISSCSQYATDSADVDIQSLCRIFELTNVFDLIHEYNFPTTTCPSWYFDCNFDIDFDCSNNRSSITQITLTDDDIGGTLITSHLWPPSIQSIDLETPGHKTDPDVLSFEGIWNWSTFSQMTQLKQFSIINNKFSGDITNQDWNNIASMTQLSVMVLAQNYFKSNFTDIHITKTSNLYELQLMDNLLYGTLDTTQHGFFSAFPNLRIFVTDNNPDLGGYFENVDALASCTDLAYFEIENNHFKGSIMLSDDAVSLSSLMYFNIRNNGFDGDIQWSVFADSIGLTTLLLSYNDFEGIIDWNIIGDLSKHRLRRLELDGNHFDGFANFEHIDVDSSIEIRLDVDIVCDPLVYICGDGAVATNRSSMECKGKTECESTCKCTGGSTATRRKVVTTKFTTTDYSTTDVYSEVHLIKNSALTKGQFRLLVISAVLAIGAFGAVLCICIYIVVQRLKSVAKSNDPKDANYLLMNL